MSTTRQLDKIPCLHKAPPWLQKQMKKSKELHYFISPSCSLLPVVYFILAHLALLALCVTSSTVLCSSNRPFLASRLAGVGQNCPTDPAHLWVSNQDMLFGLETSQRPLIPLFTYKSRIPDQDKGLCLSGPVVSHIYWSISLHLTLSPYRRFPWCPPSPLVRRWVTHQR